MSHNVSPMPFVLQRDYISVVVNGKAERVTKGQPTFKQLYKALEKGQWGKVPKLVSLAAMIADRSHGKVTVNANGVFYKGQKIDNSITTKINELIRHNKPVAHVLRFMDNLYKQPDVNTVNEIYEWLSNGRFALTDDGCFLAYKVVKADYTDCHTGTIDNSVGQIVSMPRKDVDPNRRNECSYGLHFCSKGYLPHFHSSNEHIMEVKVNPADVVAIPIGYNFTKGRTWRYEVLREVQPGEMIVGETDSPVMMQPVIEIAKERAALIKQVKALPTVQRLMRRGKLTSASFSKASVPRLTGWLKKFSRMDIAPAKSKLFDNVLRFHREAAGFTIGQVAKEAGLHIKDVYNAERSQQPEQEVIDSILKAIAKLQGNTNVRQSGLSFPKPTKTKAAKVAAYATSSYSTSATAVMDEDEDEDEDDDDDNYSSPDEYESDYDDGDEEEDEDEF
jgi:hypothetical protein